MIGPFRAAWKAKHPSVSGIRGDDGTDQTIHDLLRCQAREEAGRKEDPTAVVLGIQSVRAASHVPAATTVMPSSQVDVTASTQPW